MAAAYLRLVDGKGRNAKRMIAKEFVAESDPNGTWVMNHAPSLLIHRRGACQQRYAVSAPIIRQWNFTPARIVSVATRQTDSWKFWDMRAISAVGFVWMVGTRITFRGRPAFICR